MAAPEYPGYGASCNGCGECCKDRPCPVSRQFQLWRDGKCKALSWRAGRYWCDVIALPDRLAVALRKIPRAARIDAIGAVGVCDAKMEGEE